MKVLTVTDELGERQRYCIAHWGSVEVGALLWDGPSYARHPSHFHDLLPFVLSFLEAKEVDEKQVTRKFQIGREEARGLVKEKISRVPPTEGFPEQLDVWENCRYDVWAESEDGSGREEEGRRRSGK